MLAKKHIEDAIMELARALTANTLKLNKGKTKFIIVVARHYEHMVDIDSLQLNNDVIERAPTARILGVIIYSHIALEQQVNDVRRKCFYYLK